MTVAFMEEREIIKEKSDGVISIVSVILVIIGIV